MRGRGMRGRRGGHGWRSLELIVFCRPWCVEGSMGSGAGPGAERPSTGGAVQRAARGRLQPPLPRPPPSSTPLPTRKLASRMHLTLPAASGASGGSGTPLKSRPPAAATRPAPAAGGRPGKRRRWAGCRCCWSGLLGCSAAGGCCEPRRRWEGPASSSPTGGASSSAGGASSWSSSASGALRLRPEPPPAVRARLAGRPAPPPPPARAPPVLGAGRSAGVAGSRGCQPGKALRAGRLSSRNSAADEGAGGRVAAVHDIGTNGGSAALPAH